MDENGDDANVDLINLIYSYDQYCCKVKRIEPQICKKYFKLKWVKKYK